MNFGRRPVLMMLFALVCLNVLIRLPRTSHEIGVDSFFIHTLSTAITEQGRIPWVLNALGYFGWYPLSYPSAGPLLISGLSQVAEITGEGSILALSILYGAIGALAGFAMARTFRRDDLFAFTVALVFSLAPRFMNFTLWSASTRNLFMVLTPVFLWALIRTYRQFKISNLAVLLSVLVVMMATHRLTILLAVITLAFVASFVFILMHRVVQIRFPRALLAPTVRRWTPWMALLGIVVIAIFMLVGTRVLDEYAEGEICSGSGVADQVCNLGVSITRSVGLALPFALVGVFMVVKEHNKGFLEAFLAFSLLALIPTLFLRQYTGFYILPFLAIFAAFGLTGVARLLATKRRLQTTFIVGALVATSGFGVAVLQFEVGRSSAISDANYNTALYLRTLPSGNFVSNDGLLVIRVASISGRSGLPVGGAGTTSQSPELLIMHAYAPEYILERATRIALGELTIEDDSPFRLDGVDALTDWQRLILFRDVDSVDNQTLIQFGLQFYVENDAYRGGFTAFDHTYRGDPFSNFAETTYAKRYKVYDGTSEDVYYSFHPL